MSRERILFVLQKRVMFPCGHLHIANNVSNQDSNICGFLAWVFGRYELKYEYGRDIAKDPLGIYLESLLYIR